MRIGEATNQDDLILALEQARKRRLDLRRGYETIWWNNIALVTGDHYASWNPTFQKFEDRDPNFTSDLSGKKPRLVINHALTVGRTELSKLTKSRPIMDILANSDENIDIGAAQVGRSALDYSEWKFKLPKIRKTALWWMIQTGLGAVYVGWDYLNDRAGHFEFLVDPASGDPTFDPERIRQLKDMLEHGEIDDLKMHRYPLGEIDVKVYSPFQLLPDETKTSFEEIQDLITTDVVDVDVLRGMYGTRSTKDLQPDGDTYLGALERRMMQRAGVPGGFGEMSTKVENGCHVHTWWLLPDVYRGNDFLKHGRMVRWTSDRKVLEISDAFPFIDGRMPFAFFEHIPTSASIWPDCIMNHIRGPNLEIDKTVSQLIENKDYMSNPMWLVATQHKIKGEVKNVAGGIVRYRSVPNIPPPQPVQGMQMPNQVEQILINLREQILDISGQSEVARGRVPQGTRSGVAVAYLQEEDDTKIAPTVENMEESIAYKGSLFLERFSQFYTFERTIRFYRRDGAFAVRQFKGADLKNNTDVICQAGSAMPKSKSSKQQYTLELIQLGILKDPHKIEQMLELGQGEPDDIDKAVSQANRENNMMQYGAWSSQTLQGGEKDQSPDERFNRAAAAIPVKAWHNHQVHLARHTSVMMDEEFDRLIITHPEIVRLFDEHVAMHQQMLAQQQQAAQAQLEAAKGAPDGPPTPPGGDNGTVMQSRMQMPDVLGGGTVSNKSIRTA